MPGLLTHQEAIVMLRDWIMQMDKMSDKEDLLNNLKIEGALRPLRIL